MATERIEKLMYNGTVKIEFLPNSHRYNLLCVDGKECKESIMSVTAITGVVDKSGALINRATKLAREYLLGLSDRNNNEVIRACQLHKEKKDEACNIGTLAHSRAEDYIKTGTMTLPDDNKVASAINGFLSWKQEHNIEFECSEVMVYSKKYNYVGLFDTIAKIDGKRYLIDFKTSNSIHMLEYGMQTTAYLKAYEEETGDKLDGIMIVKFSKDEIDSKGNPIPVFEVQEIIETDYFYKAFLSAKVLKEAVKKYEKW